jgi:fructokinase
LGRGFSQIDRIYNAVLEKWGKYVFSETVETKLLKAKHGDSSGVRCAAWLF